MNEHQVECILTQKSTDGRNCSHFSVVDGIQTITGCKWRQWLATTGGGMMWRDHCNPVIIS